MQAPSTLRLVHTDWTASYADPLSVAAGEALVLSGREDLWDGHRWLWARGPERCLG